MEKVTGMMREEKSSRDQLETVIDCMSLEEMAWSISIAEEEDNQERGDVIFNPRRACARVTVVDVCVCVCVSVCVSVYLSVPALAASVSVEDSKQRYSRVSLRLTAGTTTGRSNIASDASYFRIRHVTSEIAAGKNSTVLCIWQY